MAWFKRVASILKNKYLKFTSYLFEACDPTPLVLFRILFGFLMALDVPQERGLEDADIRFNDSNFCFFPLFDFIQPLPVNYACILYSFMWIGSLGILFGFYFRPSCVMYLVPYLYFYLLDKSRWNNHSYLFALIVILLSTSDAGKFYSLDKYFGTQRDKTSSTKGTSADDTTAVQIPNWNYFMIKFQLFILYFYAAVKKIDADWLAGYSMRNLSKHKLFGLLGSTIDDKLIDYYMIHMGGFLFDLTIGFMLNIEYTKKFAFLLSYMFHGLNAILFDIGMFPYVCLASLILFCKPYEFPCNLVSGAIDPNSSAQPNLKQKQTKAQKKVANKQKGASNKQMLSNSYAATTSKNAKIVSDSWKNWKLSLMGVYAVLQLTLPFTHSITKGYNNWTNGLYGYSWDMMVYSWSTLHTKITVKDTLTGELRFLEPDVWTTNDRWSSHADMAKQYAKCIEKNLAQFNVTSIQVYFDVWKSLNGRFQQRMFNPRIDILKANWSPWLNVSWVLPLLTEFSHWRRNVFEDISAEVTNWAKTSNVIFVADYPGLYLENYLPRHLKNISVILMKGKITVAQDGQPNVTLKADAKDFDVRRAFNMRVNIEAEKFHKIYTKSKSPSCYMYTYTNATADSETSNSTTTQETPTCTRILNTLKGFASEKVQIFSRSFYLIINAYLNVLFDVPMVVRKPTD